MIWQFDEYLIKGPCLLDNYVLTFYKPTRTGNPQINCMQKRDIAVQEIFFLRSSLLYNREYSEQYSLLS